MTVSAVIIARNEEKMIANCIDTLSWCDEVIVVDNNSTDSTVDIAKRQNTIVVSVKEGSFPELRNAGKDKATSDWILYIDADERVTPKLKREIHRAVRNTEYNAYSIARNNIHYGKWMQHGGWMPDAVVRLFRKEALKQWSGDVHEHAEVSGQTGYIAEPLVHLTHRNMMEGLEKTMRWTPIEAELMLKANHPKMTTLRFLKIGFFEFIRRFIFKRAWKDGVEGSVEAMVQMMNRFIVYEQLWEMQRKPSLPDTYKNIEKEIMMLWKNEKE